MQRLLHGCNSRNLLDIALTTLLLRVVVVVEVRLTQEVVVRVEFWHHQLVYLQERLTQLRLAAVAQ
jgi:hypothetical protein